MTQPRISIIWDDMHLRDERAFTWIHSRCEQGEIQFTFADLASVMRCHENTAVRIVHRLIGAGMIEQLTRRYQGYVYRVVKPQ